MSLSQIDLYTDILQWGSTKKSLWLLSELPRRAHDIPEILGEAFLEFLFDFYLNDPRNDLSGRTLEALGQLVDVGMNPQFFYKLIQQKRYASLQDPLCPLRNLDEKRESLDLKLVYLLDKITRSEKLQNLASSRIYNFYSDASRTALNMMNAHHNKVGHDAVDSIKASAIEVMSVCARKTKRDLPFVWENIKFSAEPYLDPLPCLSDKARLVVKNSLKAAQNIFAASKRRDQFSDAHEDLQLDIIDYVRLFLPPQINNHAIDFNKNNSELHNEALKAFKVFHAFGHSITKTMARNLLDYSFSEAYQESQYPHNVARGVVLLLGVMAKEPSLYIEQYARVATLAEDGTMPSLQKIAREALSLPCRRPHTIAHAYDKAALGA